MYCPHCGSQLDDQASQCDVCQQTVRLASDGRLILDRPPDATPPLRWRGMEGMARAVQPLQPMPPSYLGLAVMSTICFSPLIGIFAVVHAAQVTSKWNGGDYDGAWESSRKAKLWSGLAVGLGLTFSVLLTWLRLILT